MTILFISDLHLEEQHPERTALFFKFLKNSIHAEALYILGDFFEAWIGDDEDSSFSKSIIAALADATSNGLPIYFMHGNRDFLIGKKFLSATGCQLLPDYHVINLYGTPTLLMHGDTLCTLDVKYLKFRKKSRTWLYKKLALLKSLAARREIVAKMRAASREHTRTTADYIMDVTQEEVERVMRAQGVKQLIHGHTHREAVHSFELDGRTVKRIVLGAWHDRGSVFICKEAGSSLVPFP